MAQIRDQSEQQRSPLSEFSQQQRHDEQHDDDAHRAHRQHEEGVVILGERKMSAKVQLNSGGAAGRGPDGRGLEASAGGHEVMTPGGAGKDGRKEGDF